MKSVFVAMSGGVDSSVAAMLLKDAGYEVRGVTLRMNAAHSLEDVREVASVIGIPHTVIDVRELFQEKVVDYFAREYKQGKTPNPCVRCNKLVKFGFLLDYARKSGISHVATGHYARIEHNGPSGRSQLLRGIDGAKDQSYFLYALKQEQLAHALMPLGTRTKEQVRALARESGLPVFGKPESQEICFIAGNDYRAFFRRPAPEGPILDRSGRTVGRHAGIVHYTVGQRRGLGIPSSAPLYVSEIRGESNAIVVGPREDVLHDELVASEVNWIVWPLHEPKRAAAKIRSLHSAAPAVVTPLADGSVRLLFDEPQWAITPGQSVVFYEGEKVLGGGVILQGWKR